VSSPNLFELRATVSGKRGSCKDEQDMGEFEDFNGPASVVAVAGLGTVIKDCCKSQK
jgi:hypothetical protein